MYKTTDQQNVTALCNIQSHCPEIKNSPLIRRI